MKFILWRLRPKTLVFAAFIIFLSEGKKKIVFVWKSTWIGNIATAVMMLVLVFDVRESKRSLAERASWWRHMIGCKSEKAPLDFCSRKLAQSWRDRGTDMFVNMTHTVGVYSVMGWTVWCDWSGRSLKPSSKLLTCLVQYLRFILPLCISHLIYAMYHGYGNYSFIMVWQVYVES